MLATTNDNTIEAWNTVLFDKFVQYRNFLVTTLGAHGTRAMDRHPPGTGARVVDLGCGFGDTSVELARRVGPAGRVMGIDAAPRFIDVARGEARGIANVEFAVADIERTVPGGAYDYAYSRMGTMFFANPVVALRNVRASLAPRGRLCMVVWRSKDANEAMLVPERVVRSIVGDVAPGDHVTCGPGPFSMASPDLVGDQLVAAGYIDIAFSRSDAVVPIGADLDDAVELALTIGPAGELVRLAGASGQARRAEIDAAVRESLQRFVRDDGVRANTAAWIVTATARD
jgi:SAM-dependent methyltransferase